MSKLTNTVKKGTLWSIVLAFLLLAGLVIGIVFGMNKDAALSDAATLTVSVDTLNVDAVEAECEKVFEGKVNYLSATKSEKGLEYEILYTFEAGTDLSGVEKTLKENFAKYSAEEGHVLQGSFVSVMTANEEVKAVLAEGYVVRGIIACVALSVLVGAYTCIRCRWDMGVMVAGASLLGMALTAALVTLCRIPVTASAMYVIAVSGLLTSVMLLLTCDKLRANKNVEGTTEEVVAESIAVKENLWIAASLAVALVAVGVAGAIANVNLLWFAVLALVGVVSATAIAVVFAPAAYLPLKKVADAKEAAKDKRYQGAKKADEE